MNIPQSQSPQHPHAEREYLHTFTAGALLPMAQATLMAFGIFIGVWMIARLVFDVIDPHRWAIFFGVLTWVAMLFRLFRHWLKLTDIQDVIMDFVDDGQLNNSVQPSAAKEPKHSVRVQIDRVSEQGHLDVTNIFDLPASPGQLNTLANGLKNSLPFTERVWVRMNKTFSRDEFEDLKDEMFAREMIEYVNEEAPQLGIRFTELGREVMKKFESPLPSPTA